jgi:hypothetical protein
MNTSPAVAVNFGLNMAGTYAEKLFTAGYLRAYNSVRGSPQDRNRTVWPPAQRNIDDFHTTRVPIT